jgi:signal transduction histidine kinase/DNA-binding response OmpR family regulator
MNRIFKIRKYSIRAKLTLIIVAISLITLLLAASLFTLTQLREQQHTLAENLSAIAEITGGNVQAALAFEDTDDATRILSELTHDPRIIAAAIYTKENKLFSIFNRAEDNPATFKHPGNDGYYFEARLLHLLHSIYIEGEKESIGSIYIQASLETLYQQLIRNISITAAIVLLSLFLSVILASRLQKLISAPILKLSEATDKVTHEQDFSVRVERDDFLEIEHLCAGFNNMLEHIETNEQQLLESHNLLEQRVTKRTEELETTNIELKKSKEIAESASKAKSQFLASISHELRTPLNAIIGFTELILAKPELDNTFKNYINIINESGDHLLALINNILDMAKIEAGKLEIEKSNVNLFGLLESIIAMLDIRALNKGINLTVEYDPALPQFINIDGLKFRQILINLIGNAVKFTDKGEVKLIVSYQANDEDKTKGKLYLSILDTGPGIKPEELNDLFSAFTQTETGRRQHGTGLGLNLSKSYIELMGGDITVDSKLGEGSRFDFNLNISIADKEIDKSKENEYSRVISNKKNLKVLIVEDIEHNRKLLIKLIEKTKLMIKVAENGLEAIEYFKEWSPDLIFMDIRMPIMDGIEALENIRELPGGNTVKIVALTASGLSDDLEELSSYKFDGFMYKPYKEREIFNMLNYHLDAEITYENIEKITQVEHLDNTQTIEISNNELYKALSEENLRELLLAAIEGDINRLRQIVDLINPEHRPISEKLNQLIDEFQFDAIISILSPLTKNVSH